MSEVATTGVEAHPLFAKLDPLSPQELELRRREIVTSAQGDYEKLTDELLEELAFITSTLRRRSVGPPKARAEKSPKAKPSIDTLLDF